MTSTLQKTAKQKDYFESILELSDFLELESKLRKESNVKVIETGDIIEVFEYEKSYTYNEAPSKKGTRESDSERERTDSILRAQSKVRRLVNANCNAFGYKPIFVTYTFSENMEDIKQCNELFTKHIRKLKIKYGKKLRYLAVPEIQEKRAEKYGFKVWHYHVVFFDLPFKKGVKQIFSESWGHGYVQIKAIQHVKNVGAYVSKYFSKQWHDSRQKNQKSYFTSHGLIQPVIHRSLDKFKMLGNIEPEYISEYKSTRFGIVTYKQYKINT